jgi:hypothetical protein
MISGCRDTQTSADVSNVESFKLPDPAGRAGGACTSALLNTLYAEQSAPTNDLTWVETLNGMREMLEEKGYSQIPQLSSSRMIDVNQNFYIAPPDCSGTRRAVLIGINYVGQAGELSGCHNDVGNIKDYIMDVHGFQEQNITVLMDDGTHPDPTYDTILEAFKSLTENTEAGDAAFVHYSGHGGKVRDTSGDEDDGYDETLVPLDFEDAGQIKDDDLFKCLVTKVPAGATLTCLMDCCHSGTVLDLPYKFAADGESDQMQYDDSFNPAHLAALAGIAGALLNGGGGADIAQSVMEQCCTLL